ncbi:AAA family ATPase [Haliangium sp.]|uniref:AAA family ATPase n=1 Tax=Haliangium sp. TaxID=2663208 RepID=UPI003D0BE2D7
MSAYKPPPPHPDARPLLPRTGLRGAYGTYLVDDGLHAAANVAITLGMPLLLTGEPGCGKTDFAAVVANALDPAPEAARPGQDDDAEVRHGLLACHVRTDTRARDLLYHYDALLRFGEAQHGDDDARTRARDPRHYVELQALGIALTSPHRRVVLVDEIDKAPRDLPNDLLRELDRGDFDIPELAAGRVAGAGEVSDRSGAVLRRRMRRPEGAPMPVVVVTSNVERQLPDPFLRRCVFFHIDFPDAQRLREIVIHRAKRPGAGGAEAPAFDRDQREDTLYLDRLVTIFEHARRIQGLIKKPSTAELINWVDALTRAFEPGIARDEVTRFAQTLDERGRVVHQSLRWTHLPGVGCLFKLHEDLDSAAAAWTAPA